MELFGENRLYKMLFLTTPNSHKTFGRRKFDYEKVDLQNKTAMPQVPI